MRKLGPLLALAMLAAQAQPAGAQMVVSGGLSVVSSSAKPVTLDRTAERTRCRRRDRNPYFVARPVYPPAQPGARASINFAPFSSKYYPEDYPSYPPVDRSLPIRPR